MPVFERKIKPYWRSACGRAIVYIGDCRKVLAQLEPEQFHAVVTDPPYGLEFMGEEWDAPWKQDGSVDARQRRTAELTDPVKAKYLRHNTTYGVSDKTKFQAWFTECVEAILCVAKPGAHLLSFGGTRMWHRMVCATEDVGWEIRDTIMWVYGNGFPKSMNVSKAIDKMMGKEREVISTKTRTTHKNGTTYNWAGCNDTGVCHTTAPATEDAKQWQGWGTALKPAYEPIILARKPLPDTVAQCVLENGTGALNIDACRVGTDGGTKAIDGSEPSYSNVVYGRGMGGNPYDENFKAGRWPANLIHDGSDEAVVGMPASAARYYYSAKADASDRPHGKNARTTHPTVKPLDLMRYLVKLVCVRGGVVIDPFMGSGSTGCAALLERMRFVGVEQSEEYADIAIGRMMLEVGNGTPIPTKKLRGM